MQDYYIDDFQIHATQTYWLSPSISGLEGADMRVTTYEKAGEDGGAITAVRRGMRAVQLSGKVQGTNPGQYEQARQGLSTACDVQLDSRGYPMLRKHRFTTLGGNQYFFFAQTTKFQNPLEYINHSDFMLQAAAPEPHLFSMSAVDSGPISLAVANGISWPVTWPVIFGGLVGGAVTVTNPGNLYSWPVIRLHGQLTNPVIANITTGQIMQLNYTLTGGDYIDIFMGNGPDAAGAYQLGKRIIKNGVDSLIAAPTNDFDWWAIQPDANLISFTSGSGADNGTMDIFFYPAVSGI